MELLDASILKNPPVNCIKSHNGEFVITLSDLKKLIDIAHVDLDLSMINNACSNKEESSICNKRKSIIAPGFLISTVELYKAFENMIRNLRFYNADLSKVGVDIIDPSMQSKEELLNHMHLKEELLNQFFKLENDSVDKTVLQLTKEENINES